MRHGEGSKRGREEYMEKNAASASDTLKLINTKRYGEDYLTYLCKNGKPMAHKTFPGASERTNQMQY